MTEIRSGTFSESFLQGCSIVFQPIFELQDPRPELYALECLFRGPREAGAESARSILEGVRQRQEEVSFDRASSKLALRTASELPGAVRLSINVHAQTLGRDPEFPRFIQQLAEENGIALSRLILEVVEYGGVRELLDLAAQMRRLRGMGIRTALDEKGLGEPELDLFLEARPQLVKLDTQLVHGAWQHAFKRDLIDAAVLLSRKIGYRIVAEGVEDVADLVTVQRSGIDLVQGFHLSKPLPAAHWISSSLLPREHVWRDSRPA